MAEFWVNRIIFSDGSSFEFSKQDIIVLVGPNNSGKSRALQNIHSKIGNINTPTQVVSTIGMSSDGTPDEVLEHIKGFSKEIISNGTVAHQWLHSGAYPGNDIKHYWQQRTQGLQPLLSFFTRLFNTDERLQLAQRTPHIDYGDEAPTHPLHYIFDKESVAQKLSENFKKAFGVDLLPIPKGSKNIILKAGNRPALEAGEEKISDTYIAKLRALPSIDEQGDGMRAYAGIIIHSIMPTYTVLMIDEPEAFLHPPQARYLGRALADTIGHERQLFVSTHSGDILRGLLDSDQENIHLIRLNRAAGSNINNASLLPKEKIKEIWSAPLLRYSDVLDGIFHERVIICESDADCRFYSAVMDWIYEGAEEKKPDIMFIHAGGVGGIDKIMKALQALSVPVSVILDFDALNKPELKTIAENLGVTWTEVDADLSRVRNAINGIIPSPPETETAKTEIQQVLEAKREQFLSARAADKIREAVKNKSGWGSAKKSGTNVFQPPAVVQTAADQAKEALNNVLDKLNSKDLFIVEIGELESFCPIPGDIKSSKWIAEIFGNEALRNQAFDAAKDFVRKVLNINVETPNVAAAPATHLETDVEDPPELRIAAGGQ